MKLILLLFLISFLNAQGRAELTPLNASKRDSAVQILTASGSRPIASRCVDIDVKSQRGELWKGTICIYYEQISGLYLWEHLLMPAGTNLRVPEPRSFLSKARCLSQIIKSCFFAITASYNRPGRPGVWMMRRGFHYLRQLPNFIAVGLH